MGEVYRGLDTKLNRPVAVKFLSGRLADPAARLPLQEQFSFAADAWDPANPRQSCKTAAFVP
jgi:hypothetical protein